MRLAVLCAVAVLGLQAAASAQAVPPEYDVEAWEARGEAMQLACTADRDSAECLQTAAAVRSDMARAILMLSEHGDRDIALPVARRMLAMTPSSLKTAAAYAIARLGPEPQDTAVLIPLLNDPVATLRRAAYGALLHSPDPVSREWVLRARPQARGERFIPDRRPMDEEALGVAPPPGAAPVWFEMEAWNDGGQVFTADGSADEVLAYFGGIAGTPPLPLAEVQAMFADDENATKALRRYANAAWFEDPRVVVLAYGVGANQGKPARLAIVWHDFLFDKTGFALQWTAPNDMPGRTPPPWRELPPGEVRLDAAALGEPGSLAAEWRKPGADDLENAIYLMIRQSDGVGAPNYLEQFPRGHYRDEVEAYLSKPRVYPVEPELIEPAEIRLRFDNMPTDRPIRFDVVRRVPPEDAQYQREAAGLQWPTEPVSGQASGEVVWRTDGLLRLGLYDIRVFYGPFEMDWDPDALRRYLPGEEAQFRRTIRVLPRLVTLSTDKAEYAPNEVVAITYDGMPPPRSPGASAPYLTIVRADAPPRDWQQYVYTDDRSAGTRTLPAPARPGAYQVRALFEEDGVVRGVADITVLDTAAAPDRPPASDTNVTITLAKPVFAPDEPIVTTVTGLSGDERDWIAVVQAGVDDGNSGRWVYTGGGTEGTFTLPGHPAGSYEIRVRFSNEYRPVRARLGFEVR